jgi:cell division septal protein FtsQ
MRKPTVKDFLNKTITSVNVGSRIVITLNFSDGTHVEI